MYIPKYLTLKIGDTVFWRGSWGFEGPKPAVVTGITETPIPRVKHGKEVTHIPWQKVIDNYCIVDLDNGHWAYGEQIVPTRR